MCGAKGVETVETDILPDLTDDQYFLEDLRIVINRNSRENKSNTPDFILAQVMLNALIVFEGSTNARDLYYGRDHIEPGG